MDQFYFEEGYLEASYFTVMREAAAALSVTVTQTAAVDKADTTGYYIPDYIVTDYFVNGGQLLEADAAFTVTATQTAVVERITQAVATVNVSATNACTVTRIIDSAAEFTAAFAPTLTATAFKNHTAVLDSVSIMSVDAVVNRSANVLLEHIANLNAMAVKDVVSSAALSTTLTATTTSQKITDVQANFTVTATISADGFDVKFADVAVNVKSQLFASRYLGGVRPRTYAVDVGPFTSTAKYGTASLQGNASAVQGEQLITLAPPKPGQDWVYESYIYPTTSTVTAADILDTSNSLFLRLLVNSDRTVLLQVSNHTNDIRTVLYSVTSSAVSVGQWHHLSVVKNSSALSFYVDGSRVGTFTPSAGWDTYGSASIPYLSQRARSNLFLDESSVAYATTYGHNPSNTTITVPTTARLNDPLTTQFLYHWESNGVDDISVQHLGQAALSTASAISAQANANTKLGAASLSTAVNVTASGGETQSATANLSSAFSQSTSADRFAGFESAVNVSVQVSTVIGSIKSAESINLVAFDTAFSATAQLAGVALLETVSAVTALAVKTTDVVSQQNTTVSITATLIGDIRAAADLDVTVTQSTDADRIRTTATTLSSAFTHTVLDTLFKGHSADLAASATITVDVTKLKIAVVNANVSASTAISAQKTTDVVSTQSLSTAVSADNLRVRFAASTQSTQVTVTAVSVLTSDPVTIFTVQTTQVTDAVKTADSNIIAVSLFTPSFDVDFITRPQVFFETQSTLFAIIGSIKQFEPSVNTGLHLPLESPYQGSRATVYPNNIQEQGYLLGSIEVPQGYAYNAGTISFWLRRDTLESNGVSLISRFDNQTTGIVQLDSTTVRVFDQGFDGLYGISWTSAFPADTQWHHVFLRYRTDLGGFYGDGYELWIDGVSQGGRTFQSVSAGIITFVAEFGVRLESNGGGSVAQLRIGNGSVDDVTVSDVYDQGYRNLGPDGRGGFNQFTTPGVYAELNAPWSNIVTDDGNYRPLYYRGSAEPIPVPTLQAYANLNARFVGVFLYAIQMQSQSELTSFITVIRDPIVDVNSSFALAIATGGGLFGGVCDLAVENTQSCTITKTTGYTADLLSTATIFARGGYEQEIAADLSVTAEVICDFDNIPPTRGEAELSSAFTLTAEANSFTDATTLTVSAFTLVCDATEIPAIQGTATLTVTVSMSVTIGSIEQFASLVMSTGTMTITAVKTTGITQLMQTTSTVTASATKFHGIILTLTAFNSQLTVGDVINLDPALTLRVLPESRRIKITQETRVRRILSETRVNIIED